MELHPVSPLHEAAQKSKSAPIVEFGRRNSVQRVGIATVDEILGQGTS